MYATVEDVKKITGTKYTDEQIQAMLDSTVNDITSVIGDVNYGIKEEQIYLCDVTGNIIYLSNIQIDKIISINDKEYTGGYKILPPQKRAVEFYDLYTYIQNSNTSTYFTIKYAAGYQRVPDDIIYAHTLITISELESDAGLQISKYKMGPRTVEYDLNSKDSYQEKAKSILNKYKILNI